MWLLWDRPGLSVPTGFHGERAEKNYCIILSLLSILNYSFCGFHRTRTTQNPALKTRAIYQCEKLTFSPGTPTSARPLGLLARRAIHHHELSVSTHISNSLHTESSSCSCSLPSKTSSCFSARCLSPAQTAFGFCHFSMPQKVPCYFQLLVPRRGKIIIYIYLSFSARAVFPACWK